MNPSEKTSECHRTNGKGIKPFFALKPVNPSEKIDDGHGIN
jgi:hypothetical protein